MAGFQQRFASKLSGGGVGPGNEPWPVFFARMAEQAQHPLLKRFYAAGTPAGDTPLAEVPLAAIDFETTGLDASKCDIVSVGIVPMTLNRIYNRQGRHWLVRPRTALSADSVVFHGITHSDIDNAPDLSEQLDDILEHLQGKVVIAHCCSIERNFLDMAVKARLGEGVVFPMLDTMALEAGIQRQPTLIERMFGARRKSIRLADSRERYGLPFYHPHHALSDALACGELFQAQIAHHYSGATAIGNLWQ